MEIREKVCEIPLTQGKVALVDAEDYPAVSALVWHFFQRAQNNSGYALTNVWRNGKRISLSMHRFLLDPPTGCCVDHANGDGLDNRRSNLRICSQAENNRNVLKRRANKNFKGVRRAHYSDNFVARIKAGGRDIHLGTFPTAEKAALAYDAEARRLHVEFARLNFALPAPPEVVNG